MVDPDRLNRPLHIFMPSFMSDQHAKPDDRSENPAKTTFEPLPKEEFISVDVPRGRMAEKHARAAPYYLFYPTVTEAPDTHDHPLSITFQELLDPSLGELLFSLHINYMVDFEWLLSHYAHAGYGDTVLTVVHGYLAEGFTMEYELPKVVTHLLTYEFGLQHAKVGILIYRDSLRVVISTSNLFQGDWDNRTQGLWLSPKCPKMSSATGRHSGESPTGFKQSLISFLKAYSLSCIEPYIDLVSRADFSAVNVFLVASVRGLHHSGHQWGMKRMGSLLSEHCRIPPEEAAQWPLVVQSSGVGDYGKEPEDWLTGQFLQQLTRKCEPVPPLYFIFPSLENVRQSIDHLNGTGHPPYSRSIHDKQKWLEKFLCEWKADHSHRSRTFAHLKSYLRLSPDQTRAAYFLLTSSNVSKSAWGKFIIRGPMRLMSFEAGVLFLPSFVGSQEYFSVALDAPNRLPVLYDLPLQPYQPGQVPFQYDIDESSEDS